MTLTAKIKKINMNDHTHVEKVIAESKSDEEQASAEEVMTQMEFIGSKITEVSFGKHAKKSCVFQC